MVIEVPGGGGSSTTTKSPLDYQEAIAVQMKMSPMKSSAGGFVGASRTDVDNYMSPGKYATGDSRFQHLKLGSNPGVTASQLNSYLKGKGVLAGMAQYFLQGGSAAGVNPIYLAVHAVLESGSGSSPLARGTVSGYGGYHNLYGIGAFDGSAEQSGGKFAKKENWNTVGKAIVGGAKFVGEGYISKGQDTLYKMRWNPGNPGNHQYATDIGWAVKQSGSIASVYKSYFPNSPVTLDIPLYDGLGPVGGGGNVGPAIIEEAKKHLGKPYKFGAATGDTTQFDCSSFTQYVYGKVASLKFPRTTTEQYKMGTAVNIQDLKAGDLIFWSGTYRDGISHVAIAMGDGNFIGAQGEKVSIISLNESYWSTKYTGARRVLSDSDVGGGSGTVPGYEPVVNDDTPTGLAGGLPLSLVNSYKRQLEDTLARIAKEGINHGLITDLKNGGSVQFFLPDDISDGNSVSWEDVAILGRSVPVKGYENSGPRTIGFELEFFAGAEVSPTGDSVDRIERDVAFLQSLTYPDYGKPFVLPPATVLLSLGKIVRLKAVVTSSDVVWKKPYTIDGRPMRATVSLEFQAVSDFPPDYFDVRFRTRDAIG